MFGDLVYSLPAREPDEDLIDKWAFQLRSGLVQDGLEGVTQKTSEIYSKSIESGNDEDLTAYNLGISAAKAYEEINVGQKDWNKRVLEGLNPYTISVDSNLRKARELLEYGIRDRETLLEKGYDL